MWLGMLAAVTAQVPGFPVAALNTINAPLLAYVAQVAAWCGRPSWAYPHVELGVIGLLASYLTLAAVTLGVPMLLRRHRVAALKRGRVPAADRPKRVATGDISSPRRGLRRVGVLALAGLVALVLAWAGDRGGADAPGPVGGLRVSVLDVGQGDAILFQPAGAPSLLVDGGPPGDDLEGKLRAVGVRRLGLAIVTHEESDHAGGIAELLGRLPVARLAYARLGSRLRAEAGAAGVRPVRIAKGATLRSGRLRVEVLWPPRELLAAPLAGADPNIQALVLLARWRDFSMLLTADAEAEVVPLDPGPVDVLKVSHHGSEDAGLDALLDRVVPRLALISVGADNSYGHPTPATLAILVAHRVPTLRTDQDGTIVLDVGRHSASVGTDG
jgi:competence protein ComEC